MTQTNNTSGKVRPLLRCIVEPPSSVAALQKIEAALMDESATDLSWDVSTSAAPSQRDSGMPSGNGGGGAGSAGDGQSTQEENPEVCHDGGTGYVKVEHGKAIV